LRKIYFFKTENEGFQNPLPMEEYHYV